MTTFCTVADAKRYIILGRNTTSDVGLLDTLCDAVTAAFRTQLNRTITQADYTEVRDGTGTNTLVLLENPVISVSSVSIGLPGARSPLVANSDYIVTGTAVKLLGGNFPRAVAAIEVQYTAGYALTPLDIRDAAAETVARWYRQLERNGQLSKTMAGETVTFDTAYLSDRAAKILQNYQRVTQVTT